MVTGDSARGANPSEKRKYKISVHSEIALVTCSGSLAPTSSYCHLQTPLFIFVWQSVIDYSSKSQTTDEVLRTLRDTKNNRAPEEDDIFTETLKQEGKTLIVAISILLNGCLVESEILSSWKHAKIFLLYKNENLGDISNYRSISLLSHSYTLSKIRRANKGIF